MKDSLTIARNILRQDDVPKFAVVPGASDVRASGEKGVHIGPGEKIEEAGEDVGVSKRPYGLAVHVVPGPGLGPGRCGLGRWF